MNDITGADYMPNQDYKRYILKGHQQINIAE